MLVWLSAGASVLVSLYGRYLIVCLALLQVRQSLSGLTTGTSVLVWFHYSYVSLLQVRQCSFGSTFSITGIHVIYIHRQVCLELVSHQVRIECIHCLSLLHLRKSTRVSVPITDVQRM